jgi:hypothetical protein
MINILGKFTGISRPDERNTKWSVVSLLPLQRNTKWSVVSLLPLQLYRYEIQIKINKNSFPNENIYLFC